MGYSINQEITPGGLLKFAAPSIVMMVFMSLYTIVDGIFVSRFLGSNALSSVNIVYPVINVAIAISTMLGTGGSAIISKYMGEGKNKRAGEALTQFVLLAILLGFGLLIFSELFLTPISRFLGASDILLEDCRSYLGTAMLFAPACMLQAVFQSFMVTAGHPGLGLILMVGAGIINIVLDYVTIVSWQMGIAGAALATGIGQCLPAAFGLLFFIFNKNVLRFCPFRVSFREILDACYNGSSEMVSQLSNAVITFLFNIVMMALAGEHGVASITIILYGQFLFNAVYLGFSIGVAPVIGFQYGAGNRAKLRKIYKIFFIAVAVSSVIIVAAAMIFSPTVVAVFTKDKRTYELASAGFRLFAVNFLFSGFNIASSGFFTALSNGRVSAIISFARTLVFIVLSLMILPRILGITGAWIAIPMAELCTLIICMYVHRKYFLMPGKQNYIQEVNV